MIMKNQNKPIQLEFNFKEPLIDILDDPNAPFHTGCTEDPETCENQFLCLCEEEMKKGGGNENFKN